MAEAVCSRGLTSSTDRHMNGDPDDEDTAFGLCDLGLGRPEVGQVSLSALAAPRAA